MLKYDTFGALLQGEGLADGAWFHIFPGGGDRLLYYQQKWVTGGTDAMADETRYQSKRNFQGAKRVFMLLPLETREHYVFVGAYDITSDARPQVPTPSGGTKRRPLPPVGRSDDRSGRQAHSPKISRIRSC